MNTNKHITRGILSVEKATLKAFMWQYDTFNLNDITNEVRFILKPYRPESTTISAKLRRLRDKQEINYKASPKGIYTKIQNLVNV
jgi:hypothetical protein